MSVNLTVQEQKTIVNVTVQEEERDITLNLEPTENSVNVTVQQEGRDVTLNLEPTENIVNVTVQKYAQDITLNLEPTENSVNLTVDPIGIVGSKGDKGDAGESIEYAFETIAQNLNDYDYVINRVDGVIDSVSYDTPAGTITKSIIRSNGQIESIQISGDVPVNVNVNKILNRDESGNIISVDYRNVTTASFLATVETTGTNETIQIKTIADYFIIPDPNIVASFNALVDWGDGSTTSVINQNQNVSHTYTNSGTYNIEIYGEFPVLQINSTYLKSVEQLGELSLKFFNLRECLNLESFNAGTCDTSGITEMSQMFRNCQNMTSCNVSSFDTSNVTVMEEMFRNCFKLQSIDLSNFVTTNVTKFDLMFFDAFTQSSPRPSSLDASGLVTSSATELRFMFAGTPLQTINTSGWDTSNVTTISGICERCELLTSVGMENWDISSLVSATVAFQTATINTTEYDQTLINWNAQAPDNSVGINFGNSRYTSGGAAQAARQSLIDNYGWQITDGGSV